MSPAVNIEELRCPECSARALRHLIRIWHRGISTLRQEKYNKETIWTAETETGEIDLDMNATSIGDEILECTSCTFTTDRTLSRIFHGKTDDPQIALDKNFPFCEGAKARLQAQGIR